MATKFYGTWNHMLPGADYVPNYPARIVDDPIKEKAARYEVRGGDSDGHAESSQVTTTVAATGGLEGQTTWYAFSARFDQTFPQNHADLGWGLTNQWHEGSDQGGSPPISMMVGIHNGQWSLAISPQSTIGIWDGPAYSIWDTPLGTDWHDMKIQVHWSSADGWIQLWHNGMRQTFTNGTDTYHLPTLIPGTNSVYYKEGYYRQALTPTGIVYLSGFRSAAEESAL